MRRFRRSALGAALLVSALVAGACGSGGGNGTAGGGGGNKGEVTVGAVNFAENQIVAEMYAQVLEDAGYTVKRQTELGSREVLQPAIKRGDVDIAPEYLGSLLLYLNPNAQGSSDPAEERTEANKLLEQKIGATLLEPSDANDTNAFVVTQETADKYNLETVGDLAPVADQLTLGGPPECPKRPFCLPGLKKVYGVEFGDFKALDVGGPITVNALKTGKIDAGLLFSTSSVIGAEGWVVLEDDKGLQQNESITPEVRQDVLDGTITSRLNEVSSKLTSENITDLNGEVELQKKDPADVAKDFLESQGLL